MSFARGWIVRVWEQALELKRRLKTARSDVATETRRLDDAQLATVLDAGIPDSTRQR